VRNISNEILKPDALLMRAAREFIGLINDAAQYFSYLIRHLLGGSEIKL
jgi:hypothetical protein